MTRARAAAGVLFFDAAVRVLLVKPTYKTGWDIPGGYLHPGETPTQCAVREVAEELGFTPGLGPLLVVDWAPNPGEGDKVLFVFDGGVLCPEDQDAIRCDGVEIGAWRFHAAPEIDGALIPRLARRVLAAIEQRGRPGVAYLEHGKRPD